MVTRWGKPFQQLPVALAHARCQPCSGRQEPAAFVIPHSIDRDAGALRNLCDAQAGHVLPPAAPVCTLDLGPESSPRTAAGDTASGPPGRSATVLLIRTARRPVDVHDLPAIGVPA